MASEEHLAILNKGVDFWNAWRLENPKVTPDLSEADLFGANLNKACLSRDVGSPYILRPARRGCKRLHS